MGEAVTAALLPLEVLHVWLWNGEQLVGLMDDLFGEVRGRRRAHADFVFAARCPHAGAPYLDPQMLGRTDSYECERHLVPVVCEPEHSRQRWQSSR